MAVTTPFINYEIEMFMSERIRKIANFVLILVFTALLTCCAAAPSQETSQTNSETVQEIVSGEQSQETSQTENTTEEFTTQTIYSEETSQVEKITDKICIQIGDYKFTATLEKTTAANELFQMLEEAPLVLELDDYSGFEKVGPLGKSLTRSDKQTTTQKGDIVLYNGSNIVMFYGSNSWSYTRLAKVDDLTNWEEALGSRSVTVTLSLI